MTYDFNLQRYLKGSRRPGKIIAISGGKGGTGKTNVSVNLAIALAQRQQEVALMDADIGLGNVEVILGLRSRENIQSVIEGKRSVMEILSLGPGGIRIVPGVSGMGHLANLSKDGQRNVRTAIADLQAHFDFVLIDTMAGIGPASVAFAVAADQVFLVTTPEPSSMLDAYAMVKAIHGLNPKANLHVLVNMVDDQRQAFCTVNRLRSASMKYLGMPLHYGGYITRDRNVRAAVLQSQPFVLTYPSTPASAAIASLSQHLLDEIPVEPNEDSIAVSGFFSRFARSLGIA